MSDMAHSFDLPGEGERLNALFDLRILDTPTEREFDEIARLAAEAIGTASAAISLVDADRQWFKARHGLPFSQTPRAISFCAHAIAQRELFVVPDASLDPRFAENPLVTRDGGIRFYAGAPLILGTGACIGTLCVIDPQPRSGLRDEQRVVLTNLAKMTVDLIETRRARRKAEIAAQVVEVTSDAVICIDASDRIYFWNGAAETMFGYLSEEALGMSLDRLVASGFSPAQLREFRKGVVRSPTFEFTALHRDGREIPVEIALAELPDTRAEGVVAAIIRDASERKRLEHDNEASRALLENIVSSLPAMIFIKDLDTRKYILLNHFGERVFGRPAEDVVGSSFSELSPAQAAYVERIEQRVIASGEAVSDETDFVRPDGEKRRLRLTRTLIDGPDRPKQYLLGLSEDLTDVRRAEAENLRLANLDSLTGLRNRKSFSDAMHKLVDARIEFALLSIDLDRFKAVNDQYGHLAGDDVLVEVGKRLKSQAGKGDLIARVGGDEFAVIVRGDNLRQRASKLAQAIIDDLHLPIGISGLTAHCGASVGITHYPADARDPAQLRQFADLALYRAKDEGRGSICVFERRMAEAARNRHALEADLRGALENGEINAYFQPVISARTGQITSAEALARWTHPAHGPIPPDVFVPMVEEAGLIEILSRNILRQACDAAVSWPDPVRVAVNLSPTLFESGNLQPMLRDVLNKTRLPGNRLLLEVTEGLLLQDVDRTFRELQKCRSLGIGILMDDFGTGYSSLSYFHRFPFDKVKIDKSFTEEIATSRTAKAIVRAVIGLGKELDMAVVAEGVETEDQMRQLVDMGCTHLQGFLFSEPVPSVHAAAIMRSGTGLFEAHSSRAA